MLRGNYIEAKKRNEAKLLPLLAGPFQPEPPVGLVEPGTSLDFRPGQARTS